MTGTCRNWYAFGVGHPDECTIFVSRSRDVNVVTGTVNDPQPRYQSIPELTDALHRLARGPMFAADLDTTLQFFGIGANERGDVTNRGRSLSVHCHKDTVQSRERARHVDIKRGRVALQLELRIDQRIDLEDQGLARQHVLSVNCEADYQAGRRHTTRGSWRDYTRCSDWRQIGSTPRPLRDEVRK